MGRAISIALAFVCFALVVPFRAPRLFAYVAITLAFPLLSIWFSTQMASLSSNVLGVSWSGISARRVRIVGWVALLATVFLYLVSLLPVLFPAE